MSAALTNLAKKPDAELAESIINDKSKWLIDLGEAIEKVHDEDTSPGH